MRHLPLLLLTALAVAGCSSPKPPAPIVIGHIAPRSGSLRDQGLAAEAAIRLAVTAANEAEDKVAGRPVEVRHPDSEGKPEIAQAVAVRLLTMGNVAALIGDSDPAAAERLCRLGAQYKVPVLTPAWLPPAALGPYGFYIGASPVSRGQALARLAVEKFSASDLLVLTDTRSPEALALSAAFAERIGGKARVQRVDYSTDDEFQQQIKLAASKQVKAILLAAKVADLEKLQAQLAGIPPPALLYGGPDDPRLMDLAGRWKQPLYWTMTFAPGAMTPRAAEFARAYEQQTQRPPDLAALLAYDAANVLFAALRQAQPLRGDKIRDELQTLAGFDSLSGPLTFDKQHAVARPVHVVQRVDGRVITLPLKAE